MPGAENKLRVKLYAQPDKTYEIAWKHIKKVELFEQMLLAEVQQYMADNRLDDAYDALQFLKQTFPKTPGLDEQLQSYLYISAGKLFQEKRWPEALAVLEELHAINPDYKPQVLATVVDKIVAGYVEQAEYRTARLFLARIRRDYGQRQEAAVNKWEEHLKQAAAVERDKARELASSGKLREANRPLRKMTDIWPDVEGGAELVSEISARYPIVSVGVTQLAGSPDIRRVDDWAARRAGRLTTRQLVEFLQPGDEGGQYAFRYGSLQISENRRRLSLQLAADQLPEGSNVTGYDLAARLLSAARKQDPDYSPTWASIMSGVSVRDVMRVDIDLRRPYVVPEAALQMPWRPGAADAARPTGAFAATEVDGKERSFVAVERDTGSTSPAEISEVLFDDPAAALAALKRGQIDVIDRVFPAEVEKLSNDSSLRLGRYVLPTLHFLIPSPKRPLGQDSVLRRAVAYGIPRETILNDQLLGGTRLAGCRVISGPFSPGTSDSDPLAYAPDAQIAPRPHDPRLAATLIGLVDRQRKIAAEKAMKQPEPLAMILGHPQSEVARVACESIAQQLTLLGLPTTLKALPPGETRDLNDECDFLYAEVVFGEPVVEARRLLGEEGAARSKDPYVSLALRRLDESTNWPEARARLKELHRIVHADVTIVPLWQLVEHYAWHKDLSGLEPSATSFYETVSAWRHGAPMATAKAN
jgi:tetratricopeptide (TPR) repeat protein